MTTFQTLRLDDLCSISRRRGTPAPADRYVGLEHITSGSGRVTGTTVEAANPKSATFAFDAACVLYGKLRPYLNKVALPDFDGVCTTDILPLVPAPGVDRRFLAAVLRSPYVLARVTQLTTGANLPRIAPETLLAIEVTVPSDEPARLRVVEAVEALEQAHVALADLHAALDELANVPALLLSPGETDQ